MKIINNDALEIEEIYKDYETKKRDLLKYKTILNRLNVEEQKQSLPTKNYMIPLKWLSYD
jgi:hypothetical protein